VSVQDDTARLIRDGIRAAFKRKKTGQLWFNVRWLPDSGFPESVFRFDLLICEPARSLTEDGADTVLDTKTRVVAAIDIVRHERFERDWHEKFDFLEVTPLYEYCLSDPTSEVMRPRLQGWRKRDGHWQRIESTLHGTFFCAAKFCLDTRHQNPQVSACGKPSPEEELLLARIELARCEDAARRETLDRKIRKLEATLANPRRVIDDDEDDE